MSADNFVAVLENETDGGYDYYVTDGNETYNTGNRVYGGISPEGSVNT